jgi:hypothetical protein
MASPSACDPAACTGETAVDVRACSIRPDDGKSVVLQNYEVQGCVDALNGRTCGTTTESRVVEVCPGPCSADGQSCEVQACSPATCAREVAEGNPVCAGGVLTQPTRRYACNASRTACESGLYNKSIQACPAGCSADGTSCAEPGGGGAGTYSVTGNVSAALSRGNAVCPACGFRLSGTGGTFNVMSTVTGAFSVSGMPAGSYRVERLCASVAPVAGLEPMDASLGYAAVTVPATGAVDVLLPKCPTQK